MNMAVKGKRSMLGSLWGPVNDPNLNGTSPALLAALRCNSDVQIPFRFPITSVTHQDECCDQKCHQRARLADMIKEAQTNQAAQAGYACDYQNKRLPIAVHEIKVTLPPFPLRHPSMHFQSRDDRLSFRETCPSHQTRIPRKKKVS